MIEVDVVKSYVHALKQYMGFAPCDHSLRYFVLQDFSHDNLYLKVSSIHQLNCFIHPLSIATPVCVCITKSFLSRRWTSLDFLVFL